MRLPRPSVANASARRTTFLRSVRLPTATNARAVPGERRAVARGRVEALEVDARVDDLRLAARLGQLRLELAAEVVGDRDHGARAADDAARERRDPRDRADVADVAAVRGDDERRVDARRDQPGRDEEVRPDDVGPPGRGDLPPQLEEAPLPAGAPVEHGELDLVPALAERALQLRHEDAEVGVVRARVHLRDEQDPHARTVPSSRRRSARARRPRDFDRIATTSDPRETPGTPVSPSTTAPGEVER